ncbi:unnamed protein product, partial [Rotaria magnacalcarata]
IHYFSATTALEKSNSSVLNSVTEDATVNFTQNSDKITFNQTVDSNVIGKSKTTDLTQPVTRKDKLEAVSHLFQLCYRTVIP